MGIAFQRERNARMPQLIRDDFDRDPGCYNQSCRCMARIVKPNRTDSSDIQKLPELPLHGSLLQRGTSPRDKDQLMRRAAIPFLLAFLFLS